MPTSSRVPTWSRFTERLRGAALRRCLLWWSAALLGCSADKSAPPLPAEGADLRPVEVPVALTPIERNNTVRDLFNFPTDGARWPAPPAIAERLSAPSDSLGGVFSPAVEPPPWPVELPSETGVHGFEGMVDGQEPSAYSVEAWQQATLHFAPYALVSPAFLACSDWEDTDEAGRARCGWDSIVRFAARAWRHPLSVEERARLEAAWSAQLELGSAEEAVIIAVSSILLSPQFTHRIEVGQAGEEDGLRRDLTSLELASRLSYFIWDTLPDTELFKAADQGELQTESQIRDQVRRMLADPKAAGPVAAFHHAWLGTDAVLTIAPARSAHGPTFGLSADSPATDDCDLDWPGIVGPLRHALYADFSLTVVDRILDGPGTFTDLLTTSVGYRAAVARPLYGDAEADSSVSKVEWPYETVVASAPVTDTLLLERVNHSEGERAGILASPAVLAVGAYPVHPGPIPRGVTILERVLCTDLGAPPEGAEGALPADIPDAEQTNRTRTELATAAEACTGCHDRINPFGFAFEHYDALGRWRATDYGLPVDASVDIVLDGVARSIEDASELGVAVAQSDEARGCYALHQVRTATGLDWDRLDPRIESLVDHFQRDDHIPTLIEEIAVSSIFRTIDLEEAP